MRSEHPITAVNSIVIQQQEYIHNDISIGPVMQGYGCPDAAVPSSQVFASNNIAERMLADHLAVCRYSE